MGGSPTSRRPASSRGRCCCRGSSSRSCSSSRTRRTPRGASAAAKLVALGRSLGVAIMTNDYGLNRVAELQGVTVLNMNDLAKAVRPVVLPGEDIAVRVIQEGKDKGQGVGYLEDGTMIVIEGGMRHVGSDVTVTVMRVLQTVGGR